jgi:glutathione S-transferase
MVDALEAQTRRPFALPFIRWDGRTLAQTPLICARLGEALGIAGDGAADCDWLLQLQLDIADMVEEVHRTHHPVATNLFYSDQKRAAEEAARHFRGQRIGKYYRHFSKALGRQQWFGGGRMSHVDTSFFQLHEGLCHMFPRAMKVHAERFAELVQLAHRVARTPPIAAYLRSDRRRDFNADGLFRYLPDLDGEAGASE